MADQVEIEDMPVDWISERAIALGKLVLVFEQVESLQAKDLVFRMANKVIDSIIMPQKAEVLKLAVNNDEKEQAKKHDEDDGWDPA